jgi:hypothetical protein
MHERTPAHGTHCCGAPTTLPLLEVAGPSMTVCSPSCLLLLDPASTPMLLHECTIGGMWEGNHRPTNTPTHLQLLEL